MNLIKEETEVNTTKTYIKFVDGEWVEFYGDLFKQTANMSPDAQWITMEDISGAAQHINMNHIIRYYTFELRSEPNAQN